MIPCPGQKKKMKKNVSPRDSSRQDVFPVEHCEPQSTQHSVESLHCDQQDLLTIQEEDITPPADDDGGADDEESDAFTTDASQKVPIKKAKRENFPPLTAGVELDLAEWYQRNPQLYNRKLSEYRNTSKKNRLYQEKADELDIHGK